MLIIKVVYYLITSILIFLYMFREKQVTTYIDNLVEKHIKIKNIKINKYYTYLLQLVSIGLIIYFYLKIDKTIDHNVTIKKYAIIAVFILNIFGIIYKQRQYMFFLMNLVLYFASSLIFNIYDLNYKILVLISMFVNAYFILQSVDITKQIQKIVNGIYLLVLVVIVQSSYLGNYVIPTGSMLPTIQLGDRIFSNNLIYKFKDPKFGDIISFKEPMNNKYIYTKRIVATPGNLFSIDEDGHLYKYVQTKYNNENIYYNAGFLDSVVYVPKKGDVVYIDKILAFNNETNQIEGIITASNFLQEYRNLKSYKDIFGIFSSDKKEKYSFELLLKVKGKEEYNILPIPDLKYNKKVMDSIIEGSTYTLESDYYLAMGDNSKNSLDSRYFGYVQKNRIIGKLLLRWYPFNRFGKVK